jgi:iron complex outermembrane receptor protein
MLLRSLALGLCLSTTTTAATKLPPILISAARAYQPGVRTAASTQVLDRAEIRASGAANLAELLRHRAGIHVSDLFGDGSSASLDMRGFGSNAGSNTLVMVDGRRLNPASDSSTPYLNRIDLARIERIEIIQGSAGVLFGNQAVGGVINIISAQPQHFETDARVSVGSLADRQVEVSVGDRAANGVGYRISARHKMADNYRDHNETSLRHVALDIDYENGANRVYLAAERYLEDTDTPGALFLEEIAADRRQSAPVYVNDYIETDSELYRLGGRQAISDHWRVEGEAAYSDDRREFVQSFRTFAAPPSTQDRTTWEINPRLVGRFGGEPRPTHVTLGLDLQHTDYLLQAFGPQAVEQRIAAVYGQLITALDDDTDISIGVRHARVSNDLSFEDFSVVPSTLSSLEIDDGVTVGSIGLTHDTGGAWELFARANQNYRFAKVDEHTNNVFGQPVGLDTQTGITYEIGARYAADTLVADALVYRIDLDDEIHFDATGFANVNIDDTRRVGLLGSMDARISPATRIGASYNYVDNEITGGPFTGRRIPLVPEHKLRLYGEYAFNAATRLRLEALQVSRQYHGGDFANRFPSIADHRVLNLSVSHAHGPWRMALRVNNLTDERYSETGNISSDTVTHTACVADAFGGFACPAQNPAPGINAWLTLEYSYD